MGATCQHAAAYIWDFQFYNYTHQVFQQHLNGSKIVVRCHRCATEENAQIFKARMRWGRWRYLWGTAAFYEPRVGWAAKAPSLQGGGRMCCALSLSPIQLFVTPWTVPRQAPLSMGILQASMLEWIVILFSRGSSQPRD